jgi:phosphoglycerol transferase
LRDRQEWGFAAAAAVLATGAATVFLRLWDADFSVPFSYHGDGALNLMLIKSSMENGWFYENGQLGAPAGQQLYDYPVLSGDGLHVVLFWLAGLVTSDVAVVMNVFFVLTFPVTAVVGYLVLRKLDVGPAVSLAIALLYTVLPYHFMRGETHLFLAAYYAVPIGAYLALAVLGGRARIGVATGVLCAVVALASGSFYYSAFTVLLVVVAAALRFLAARDRAAVAAAGFFVGVILGVSLLQLSPTIVYRIKHGTNEEVAQRFWFESENYGLRLTQLLLPVDDHRIDALASRKAEYKEQIPQNEGTAATLGIVGSIGFLWLLGVVLAACVGSVRGEGFALHRHLAALTVASVLMATTGGLATLFAVVWPQIRAWNRLSVFIAFFALAAVALLLEAAFRRFRLPGVAVAAVLGALVVVGALDQTAATFIPPHSGLKAEWEADRDAVAVVQASLPEGAAVVQLPYEPFPEPPPGPRPIYEPAKPYIHYSDLQWSWGAMKGRPDDWAGENATKPAAELVPAAREAGFEAIMVDRLAYADGGAAAEADLRRVLGANPARRSPDSRYLLWFL